MPYLQAIPLFLADDLAVTRYFANHRNVLDALTGEHLVVLIPREVQAGDAGGIMAVFDGSRRAAKRFPNLERANLPCLWIESAADHAVLELPNDHPGLNKLFRVLADEATRARSADGLAAMVRRRTAAMNPWTKPLLFVFGAAVLLLSLIALTQIVPTLTDRTLAFMFGLVFIVALLALAIAFPNPTPFQYQVFRIVLAIAIAGIAATIPGFLEVTLSTWLKAGGALGVFAVVYFFNPASLVATPPPEGT